MGNRSYNEFLALLRDEPHSADARERVGKAMQACNFGPQRGSGRPFTFDVWTFDREDAQVRCSSLAALAWGNHISLVL